LRAWCLAWQLGAFDGLCGLSDAGGTTTVVIVAATGSNEKHSHNHKRWELNRPSARIHLPDLSRGESFRLFRISAPLDT
ncbi:MAG: hypothetical protein OXF00_13800, partial [bacterium]|nr:hypothetical protein [bacterium]